MINKIILDGRKVLPRDRMYSLAHGWVEVSRVGYPGLSFPIDCVTAWGQAIRFSSEGKLFLGETSRILYWCVPAIILSTTKKNKVLVADWIIYHEGKAIELRTCLTIAEINDSIADNGVYGPLFSAVRIEGSERMEERDG